MSELWSFLGGLEEGQAEVLTTFMLIVGGGLGVWLGSVLYGKRVTDLKSAVEETEEAIVSLRDNTSMQLQKMQQQLEATMEQLSRARREITEIAPIEEDGISAFEDELNAADEQGDNATPLGDRTMFKNLWYAIRRKLKAIASSDDIHGLRRNKYDKYNNYQTSILIDDMLNDGVLESDMAKLFHEAHDLFVWHRNGRPRLTQTDVDRMRDLSVKLGAR